MQSKLKSPASCNLLALSSIPQVELSKWLDNSETSSSTVNDSGFIGPKLNDSATKELFSLSCAPYVKYPYIGSNTCCQGLVA